MATYCMTNFLCNMDLLCMDCFMDFDILMDCYESASSVAPPRLISD